MPFPGRGSLSGRTDDHRCRGSQKDIPDKGGSTDKAQIKVGSKGSISGCTEITGAEGARRTFQTRGGAQTRPKSRLEAKASGNVGLEGREHIRDLRGPEAVKVYLLLRP